MFSEKQEKSNTLLSDRFGLFRLSLLLFILFGLFHMLWFDLGVVLFRLGGVRLIVQDFPVVVESAAIGARVEENAWTRGNVFGDLKD